jgi:hypothetical protein
VEGGNLNDNTNVAKFLKDVNAAAQQHNAAVILSVHSPKMKKTEEYQNLRDRVLGAVAWGGYSSTVILLNQEDPANVKDASRRLVVMPRNYPSRQYHLTMTPKGRLVEAETGETVIEQVGLLSVMTPGVWYSRQQLLAAGKQEKMSTSTVDRHLKALSESGQLEKDSSKENWRERRYMLPPERLIVPPSI